MKAFRVYDSFMPDERECPDGTMVADAGVRQERWGAASNRCVCVCVELCLCLTRAICWWCLRYYEMAVEYFTSSLGEKMLGIMAHDFLWTRTLTTTSSLDKEVQYSTPVSVWQPTHGTPLLCWSHAQQTLCVNRYFSLSDDKASRRWDWRDSAGAEESRDEGSVQRHCLGPLSLLQGTPQHCCSSQVWCIVATGWFVWCTTRRYN